jgi:hypothetical protein
MRPEGRGARSVVAVTVTDHVDLNDVAAANGARGRRSRSSLVVAVTDHFGFQ